MNMKELRWVTTNKHNSPAAGATQGYLCLFATVMGKFKKRHSVQTREPPTIQFDTSYHLRLTKNKWRPETILKTGRFRKAL